MSDRKNALKLTGNYNDFNLNLKIILSPLFDAQKKLYQKNPYMKHLIFWPHLFRLRQYARGQENRNDELRKFWNSPICWKKLKIEAFILNTGRMNMTSNFNNILTIVVKWKYSSIYRFRPTLRSFCDYFKNGCAFHKIQIITRERIVVFVFNYNIMCV